MSSESWIDSLPRWHRWLFVAGASALLVLVSRYNYLAFHFLAELATIIVAFIMTVVAWHTYTFSRNHFLMYLGLGYFWIAILDICHVATYPGMQLVASSRDDLSTGFWTFTRLLEALLLLSSIFVTRHTIKRSRLMSVFGLIAAVVIVAVFAESFPLLYQSGFGLTSTKVTLEYVVVAILAVTAVLFYRKIELRSQLVRTKMLWAVGFTIVSELAFTLYVDAYGLSNLVGHVFKLFSYWMVYEAIIRVALQFPLHTLTEVAGIYDAIPDATLAVDRQGIIRQANRKAEKWTGVAVNELVGQHCHNLFHNSALAVEDCPLCRAISRGERVESKELMLSVEQGSGWFRFSLAHGLGEFDSGYMIHVVRDITQRKWVEARLARSEKRFRQLVENLGDVVFFYAYDHDHQLSYLSPSFEQVLGYSRDVVKYHFITMATDAALNDRARENMRLSLKGLVVPPYDLEVRNRSGELCYLQVSEVPVFGDDGSVKTVEGIAYDVTERVLIEQELRRKHQSLALSQQRLALHIEHTPLAVIEWDHEWRVTEWNRSAERIFGYSRDSALGQGMERILPQTERPMQLSDLMPERKTTLRQTNASITRTGRQIICEWHLTRLVDEQGRAIGVAALVDDVTEREVARSELMRQANYDTLTGLPNRLLANDRLNQAVKYARRYKKSAAVLFVDLDMFKHVNDTMGHEWGDRLLQQVSIRLQSCVREQDTVARLGGDEFLVILAGLNTMVDAELVAEKILTSVAMPFVLDGHNFFLSASIGITGFPGDQEDVGVLLRNADTAMYKAKEEGRNTYCFYTDDMNLQARERMTLESELRQALDNKELYLVYQPQVNLLDGQVVGVEALLRWRNGALGEVEPSIFIPVAESAGMIDLIGSWVLADACRQLTQWYRQGFDQLVLAVNVSSRQLRDEGFVENLQILLRVSGCPPERLKLEITESTLLADEQQTRITLEKIKMLGVGVVLDDFGVGYSSLSYLSKYAFNTLKIDRSFVQNANRRSEDASLCRAIVAMARSLNLQVIAEGVECKEQLEFLKEAGVTIVQGFLYSRPVTAGQLERLLVANEMVL